MESRARDLLERHLPPLLLVGGLGVIAVVCELSGAPSYRQIVIELLINVVLVVGLHIFVGNSGILSFGHLGFVAIGAYTTAWLTLPIAMKEMMTPGLPALVMNAQAPAVVAAAAAGLVAAAVAFVTGLVVMRLAGVAASIATLAFLAIVNIVFSNWDSVTGGKSSLIGIPPINGVWVPLVGATTAIVIAHVFDVSRYGVALRATREEPIAASASGLHATKLRVVAYVISAFVVGIAGNLHAGFIGVVSPDDFYLAATFFPLATLVIGGIFSLSGAVIGVVAMTAITEVLLAAERGVSIFGLLLRIPNGTQEFILAISLCVILVFRPRGLIASDVFTLPTAFGRPRTRSAPVTPASNDAKQ